MQCFICLAFTELVALIGHAARRVKVSAAGGALSMNTGTGVATRVTDNAPKWLGQPTAIVTGSLEKAYTMIPKFDRRPFGLENLTGGKMQAPVPTGVNEFWDMIIRMPLNDTESETPVGIVSKTYKLVQHQELFDGVARALSQSNINPNEVRVELTLTVYAGRMAARFILPERFAFNPGDKELKMNLVFECWNSVDGSSRLIITLGWLRLVCMNGLMVGTSRLSQRFIHNEYLEIPDLHLVLRKGIAAANKEIDSYSQWLKTHVDDETLIKWIDTTVKKKWGSLAAARTYLICTKGHDGKFADPFEKAPPHAKAMEKTKGVPGSLLSRDTAYSICQALAWIAKERRDIQDQLDWMREIPDLMGALLR
jgi:hypothetical protein